MRDSRAYWPGQKKELRVLMDHKGGWGTSGAHGPVMGDEVGEWTEQDLGASLILRTYPP